MAVTFDDLRFDILEVQASTGHKPKRVRMNKDWKDKEIEKYPIFKEKRVPKLRHKDYFMDIPVEFDDTISTYEFVYAEGKY